MAFVHKIDYYFLFERHQMSNVGTHLFMLRECFFFDFNYYYCLVNRHNTLRWNAFQLISFPAHSVDIFEYYMYINEHWSVSIHIKSNCELYGITYFDGKHMTIAVTQKKNTHLKLRFILYQYNILQSRHKSYVFLSPQKKIIHSFILTK